MRRYVSARQKHKSQAFKIAPPHTKPCKSGGCALKYKEYATTIVQNILIKLILTYQKIPVSAQRLLLCS